MFNPKSEYVDVNKLVNSKYRIAIQKK